MKKAVILFAIAQAILSCSTQEDTLPLTTSVVAHTANEFGVSNTATDVKRGQLFAWISEIQITATHQSGYSSTTDYILVDNTTPDAQTKFIIENVQIGENNFTASTKTTEPERLEAVQILRSEDFQNSIAVLNARNPYATYSSPSPVTYNIINGTAQNVTIPLQTQNSRFIALFTIDDSSIPIKNYKINCFVDNQPFGPRASCDRNYNITFYWSDRNSIAGKTIYFEITHGKDIYTTEPKILRASNTTKMRYTISNDTLQSFPM